MLLMLEAVVYLLYRPVGFFLLGLLVWIGLHAGLYSTIHPAVWVLIATAFGISYLVPDVREKPAYLAAALLLVRGVVMWTLLTVTVAYLTAKSLSLEVLTQTAFFWQDTPEELQEAVEARVAGLEAFRASSFGYLVREPADFDANVAVTSWVCVLVMRGYQDRDDIFYKDEISESDRVRAALLRKLAPQFTPIKGNVEHRYLADCIDGAKQLGQLDLE